MVNISTGTNFLDKFLGGGYDTDAITTLYGPSGSGKTNLCLLAAVHCAQEGKKVIFVDTEGGIGVERIKQLCGIHKTEPETDAGEDRGEDLENNFKKILLNILFFHPSTFEEQKIAFSSLSTVVQEKWESIGLIVVDSFSTLYRLEIGSGSGSAGRKENSGNGDSYYEAHSALGRQLASLIEIARKKKIPSLLSAQVYDDFGSNAVKIVGGNIIRYASKCLLELEKLRAGSRIIVRKHRSLPEGKECRFRIVQEGMKEA